MSKYQYKSHKQKSTLINPYLFQIWTFQLREVLEKKAIQETIKANKNNK